MAPLALIFLLGTVPTTVSLSPESSCAPREVLQAELGAVFVKEGTVRLRLEKDGHLTLEREGKLVLSRSLGAGTCEELGRAAAVVVGRWIHELQKPIIPIAEIKPPEPKAVVVPEEPKPKPIAEIRPPEPKPVIVTPVEPKSEPTPEIVVDAGTPPTEEVPDVVATIGTSPPTTALPLTPTLSPAREREKVGVGEREQLQVRVTHLEVLAGGGVTVPGAPSLNPIISLDVALVFNERLRIDLAGLFDFGGSVKVFDEAGQVRGQLTTRGGAILPGAGYCLVNPLRICLGAVAGLRIIEGESSGSFVFQTRTSRAAPFVFGPHAQLAFIRGLFHAALDLSLLVTPEPPTFRVTGLPTTLPFPLLEGLFRLSVGVGTAP